VVSSFQVTRLETNFRLDALAAVLLAWLQQDQFQISSISRRHPADALIELIPTGNAVFSQLTTALEVAGTRTVMVCMYYVLCVSSSNI